MTWSRTRLRVPAALVAGLLLLTGAGEVLGACYCAHRGGHPMEGHGVGYTAAPVVEAPPAGGAGAVATPRTRAPAGHHDHDHGDAHSSAPAHGHATDGEQTRHGDAPAAHHPGSADDGGMPGADDHGTAPDRACRALCAVACSVHPNPTPRTTERVPDLVSCAHVAPVPPVEPTDLVPVTAQPHVLPLSQAPPTKA